MNRRTIGIFIAATIAVMIIASTNIVPMIQLRQVYAASPTISPIKDNIRASLGNRNQHLNQQGNCELQKTIYNNNYSNNSSSITAYRGDNSGANTSICH